MNALDSFSGGILMAEPPQLPHAGTDLTSREADEPARTIAEAALRHSELRFKTLMECLPQRVFFKDRNSRFLFVNSHFASDFRLTPAALVGKNDADFFPAALAEKYVADDRRVMQQRRPETIEEINVVNGRTRVVEVVKAPVVDANGDLLGLLGVFSDITERKLAEERLRDFAGRLERSNRELQDFAYVASHDLQEPLRKVAVFSTRLAAKSASSLGPEAKDYLERIQKAVTRMQTLINDLLTFSRVTTKPQPFVKVDLGQVTHEVLGDLEIRLEQAGGRVQVGSLPSVEADALQMRQLFQNLIGNALKFQRPGIPPEVDVRSETLEPTDPDWPRNELPRDWVRITVRDNGIGFEDKYADRIFQVFQRLHTRGEYEGTGMGLAIARKIVEHHGGRITAHGSVGEGATFRILFPTTQIQH